MSFVSTGNKPVGNGGPVITTPPIAAITGRGESQKIWYYHTDGHGTGGNRAGRDAGVGGLPGGIWRKPGRHQQQRGVL